MTSEQWIALVGQVGIGGIALLGLFYMFVKVIVPMVAAKVADLVAAINHAAEEVKQLRTDLMTAQETTANAVHELKADLGGRISRLEGIFDHRPNTEQPTGARPISNGRTGK